MITTEINTGITPSRTRILYAHITLDGNDEPLKPIWSAYRNYDNIRAEFCLSTGKLIRIETIKDD